MKKGGVALFAAFLFTGVYAGEWGGFVEGRLGTRLQEDPLEKQGSVEDLRAQVATRGFLGPADYDLCVDFLYNGLNPDLEDVNLETGNGWLDLRSANILWAPVPWMDLKIGRQTLTWGTGDLVFLNDLFPKDWVSFFNGRDIEYLKAPSDSVYSAMYFGDWILDLVWSPRADTDRYLTGTYMSFYPFVYTADNPLPTHRPHSGDASLRLKTTFGEVETALYGYYGFWKSPAGFTAEGVGFFPDLQVVGGSALTPFAKGIGNVEVAYYNSSEDSDGSNPMIQNSEARFLLGYQQELMADLSMGAQAYSEWLQDYEAYKENLQPGEPLRDEWRQLLTLRLTWFQMNQTLMLSSFIFYSPTDVDGYARLLAEYKWSDTLTLSAGANLFAGESETFFGQFQDDTNMYVAVRRWW